MSPHGRIGPIVGIVAFMLGGCVSSSTHEAALRESETAKATLDRVTKEAKALGQQATVLKDLNEQEELRLTLLLTELQKEHTRLAEEQAQQDALLGTLQQKIEILSRQRRLLMQQVQNEKQETGKLEALANRYERDAQEASRMMERAPLPSVSASPVTGVVPGSQTFPPQPQDVQPPVQSQQAPPAQPTAPPAPAQDAKNPVQADEGWFATVKGWLSSLWDWVMS